MNKIIPVLFLIPVLLLAVWVHFLQTQRELGREVVVSITGYDPRDLLAGHYIQYTIDWDKTDCSQFKNNICPRKDFYSSYRRNRANTPLRFYVPAEKASQLDRLLRNNQLNNMKFEISFSYQPGKQPIAKQLLINGKDWRDIIQ